MIAEICRARSDDCFFGVGSFAVGSSGTMRTSSPPWSTRRPRCIDGESFIQLSLRVRRLSLPHSTRPAAALTRPTAEPHTPRAQAMHPCSPAPPPPSPPALPLRPRARTSTLPVMRRTTPPQTLCAFAQRSAAPWPQIIIPDSLVAFVLRIIRWNAAGRHGLLLLLPFFACGCTMQAACVCSVLRAKGVAQSVECPFMYHRSVACKVYVPLEHDTHHTKWRATRQ